MCENPKKGGSRSLLHSLVYSGLFLELFLDLLDLSIEEGTHFDEENY
jgi:hypothetical protein